MAWMVLSMCKIQDGGNDLLRIKGNDNGIQNRTRKTKRVGVAVVG